MKRITAILIGLILVIGLLVGMILLPLNSPSNCGGNSYALYACENYVTITHMAVDDGKSVLSNLGEAEKSEAAKLAMSHWISGADFLVRTNFTSTKTSRIVAIVCEKSFGNVPQPTLWNFYRKNPAHAVGYSEGSAGLISPAEFKALDLTGFIHLSSLGTNFSGQSIQP